LGEHGVPPKGDLGRRTRGMKREAPGRSSMEKKKWTRTSKESVGLGTESGRACPNSAHKEK